jgi:hypothetical protein
LDQIPGEQSPGDTTASTQKLVVTSQLAGLDIDIIEVGFPTSLPDDLDAVRSIAIEVGNMPVGKDGHVPVICTLLRFNKRGIGAAWKAMHPPCGYCGLLGTPSGDGLMPTVLDVLILSSTPRTLAGKFQTLLF